ncbi:MAG: hypothetical protein O7A08_04025 [SAR324 cluster bacterium]|nr:hypothetical protein [SAR324 cluster bacterium]
MGQALEVANRYYDIWRNNGEGLADVLSDDFSFVGPLDQLDREGMLAAVPHMGPALQEFHMKKQFENGGEVCCIYDLDMATPGGKLTIPMAECITVSGGKISGIRLYFDPRELAAAT